MIKKLLKLGLILTFVISSVFSNVKPMKAVEKTENLLQDVVTRIEEGYLYTTFTVSDSSRVESIKATFINQSKNNSLYVLSRDGFNVSDNEITVKTIIPDYLFDTNPQVCTLYEVNIHRTDGIIEMYEENEEILFNKKFILNKEDYFMNFVTLDDFYYNFDEFCDYIKLYKGSEKFGSFNIQSKLGGSPYDIEIINNPALNDNSVIGEEYIVDVEFKVDLIDGYKTFVFKDIKAKILEEPKVFSNLQVNVKDEKIIMEFESNYPYEIRDFSAIFKNEAGTEYWLEQNSSHVSFDIINNQVILSEYLPLGLYETDDITTYTLTSLSFNTYQNQYSFTNEDEEIKNKSFVIDPNNNYYTNISAEDIDWEFKEGTNPYLSLYKNVEYFDNNIEFKTFGMNFEFVTLINNPVFDDNVKTDEIIEVSALVKSYFKERKYYIVNHIPAKVSNVSTNLKGVSLEREGNYMKLNVDHQYYDEIEDLSAEFIYADGTIDKKVFDPIFIYYPSDPDAYVFEFPSNQIMDADYQDYYLKKLTITCHGQTEVYTTENTDILDEIYIRFEKKENPYDTLTAEDIHYRFISPEEYLKIDRNTKEYFFENIQFSTYDGIAQLKPRIIYYNETSENEIFEVSVIVQAIYGNEVKEFKIDHIPAKYVDREKTVSDIKIFQDKSRLHFDIDYRKDQKIYGLQCAFVNENNSDDIFYVDIPGGSRPLLQFNGMILDCDYPNEITNYKILYLELLGDKYTIHIEESDPLLKDLSITLDPKDCSYYTNPNTIEEAMWYFRKNSDSLLLQKTTDKVDYSKINIINKLSYLENGVYIKKFEVINNPALKPNANPNKMYQVDAKVTYKTIGGYERTYLLKKIPAKIIEPIGEIEGPKTEYKEFAVPYIEYLKNNLDNKWDNRDPKTFSVKLKNNKKKDIIVNPFTISDKLVSSKKISYFENTTYYDPGLEYIFKGTDEDIPFYDEFMNDIYYVNKNVLYLVDEDGNIVDRTGKVLMKYENRPIRSHKSNVEEIKLSSKEGSIPSYTEMEATKNDTLDDVYENYVAYDMSLIAKDEEVHAADEVEVGISVPKYMEGSEMNVVYIDESGNPTDEIFDVNIKDGVAYFETNHFSTYALVTKDEIKINVPEINENTDLKNLDIEVNGQRLKFGVDYDYSVKESISVEDENIMVVEVTIKFIGEYSELEDIIKVYKVDIKQNTEKPNISIPEITEDTNIDEIVIKDGANILIKDKDYTITKKIEEDKIIITIKFIGDYSSLDSIVKVIQIGSKESVDTSDSMNKTRLLSLMLISISGLFIIRKRKLI